MHEMLDIGIDTYIYNEREKMFESIELRKKAALNNLVAEGTLIEAAKIAVNRQFTDEEKSQLSNLDDTLDRNKKKLTNCVNDIYDDILISMKTDNEKALRGLRHSLDFKRDQMHNSLKTRLSLREKNRSADLKIFGLNEIDASRRASLEFGTLAEDIAALDARLDVELKEVLQGAEAALANAKQEFDRNSSDKLSAAEDKEAIDKFKQIVGISGNQNPVTVTDLSSVKISTDAVLAALDERIVKLRQEFGIVIENIKLKHAEVSAKEIAELNESHENARNVRISELIRSGVSRNIAIAQAQDELFADEEAALVNLRNRLDMELDVAITKKRRELEKQELLLVESEFTKASIANSQASNETAAAKKLVSDLKLRYESELQRVRGELKANQKAEADSLRNHLAARRAKHETKLSVERADAETRRKEFNKLALKEEEEVSALRQKHLNEELVKISLIDETYLKELAEAEALSKQRERSAAIAALTEAALSAERDARARSEADLARKELERLKFLHAQENSKLKDIKEAKRTKGKEKLEDKLAAKRARRELELKKEEDQKMAMLIAKQASESSEAKALRDARTLWMKKIEELSKEATDLNIVGISKENHIFQQLFKLKYVPALQYEEAVKVVLGPRHTKESVDMLQVHYEQRVECLKPIVSVLLQEKNKIRIDTLEHAAEQKLS
jgi:hypothetical protein